jgi:hypothetical protein
MKKKHFNQCRTKSLRISLLAVIAVTFIMTSCSDPCSDTVCLNGGACADGTCVCPDGFTGENCQTIVSNNGGNSHGPNVQIKITNITVSGYPATNNGSNWDYYTNGCLECNYPDPSWKIIETTGGSVYTCTSAASNTTGVVNFNSNSGLPVLIQAPNQVLGFEVWDYDSQAGGGSTDFNPDFMIGTQFNLYQSAFDNGFPSSLTISGGGTSLQVSLALEYID